MWLKIVQGTSNCPFSFWYVQIFKAVHSKHTQAYSPESGPDASLESGKILEPLFMLNFYPII